MASRTPSVVSALYGSLIHKSEFAIHHPVTCCFLLSILCYRLLSAQQGMIYLLTGNEE